MSRHLFQSKREDGRPVWRVGYDYLIEEIEQGKLNPGDVIEHDDLAEAMEVPFPSSLYYQSAIRISRELESEYGRTLVSVKGQGYKLVAGRAMSDKGLEHHTKSKKQMALAVRTVSSVRLADLGSQDERALVRKIRDGLVLTATVLDMQAERVAEHEKEIEQLKNARLDDRARVKATETEIEGIRARLRLLEEQQSGD